MVAIWVAIILPTGTINAAGPGPLPASYKPLPVGTVLDYGSWKCKIESIHKLESVCVGDQGEKLRTVGNFMAIGVLPVYR